MKLIRKIGILMMIMGFLIAFPVNIFLIEFVNENVDFDIFGVLIFVIGLLVVIVFWRDGENKERAVNC